MTIPELQELRDQLIREAEALFAAPPSFVSFTRETGADKLLNDLEGHPHAFVIGCIADLQIRAERAWLVPYRLKERLGYFDFPRLASTSLERLVAAMSEPPPLLKFYNKIGRCIHQAIKRIADEYNGDASRIWAGKPPSAAIVRRFLEFDGVGPKIATMAANILVRKLCIEVSDRYSIDISVDTHVRRVFSRLGFVPQGCSTEYIIYRARELWPEYPGRCDLILWTLGHSVCRATTPQCNKCSMSRLCAYAQERRAE